MNINGVKLTDKAIDMLRNMQEEDNSTLDSLLDGVDEIEDVIVNPDADLDFGTRLCMMQNIREVKKLIRELKVHPGYVYE